jgi:site-specific recombinase XerD
MDTRKAYGFKPGTPLFCTLEGKPVHPQYARDLLHRLGKRAGIEKRCHPHGLRHAYADELRRAGVDVVTISKLLGHSSIAVTARYLDHLSNADAIATLEAVELPELGL